MARHYGGVEIKYYRAEGFDPRRWRFAYEVIQKTEYERYAYNPNTKVCNSLSEVSNRCFIFYHDEEKDEYIRIYIWNNL